MRPPVRRWYDDQGDNDQDGRLGNGVLLFALIFLTSLSLYRGFAEDMAHGGYVLPTAYKKFTVVCLQITTCIVACYNADKEHTDDGNC